VQVAARIRGHAGQAEHRDPHGERPKGVHGADDRGPLALLHGRSRPRTGPPSMNLG